MTAEIVKMEKQEPKKKPAPKFRVERLNPTSIVDVWRLFSKSISEGHPAYPYFDETAPEDLRAHLFAQMSSPAFIGWTLKNGRKPMAHILGVGFSRAVGLPSKYIQVIDFYVEPEWRDHPAVAKALLQKFLASAKAAGFHHWEASVTEASAKLIKNASTLYVRVGGKTT